VSISAGDLRKAITTLQSVSSLYDEQEVTEDAIVEVAGVRVLSSPRLHHPSILRHTSCLLHLPWALVACLTQSVI
jgi:hypothetical protein